MRITLCIVTSLVVICTVVSQSCDRAYRGQAGVITSYNYPFDYHQNLTCIYRIYVNAGSTSDATGGSAAVASTHTVCFRFYRFRLENSTAFCSFDYLMFNNIKYCRNGLWQYGYNTGHPESNIWARAFCWTVKGPWFDVSFTSDNSMNSAGFYATYDVHDGTPSFSAPTRRIPGEAPCNATDWTCFNRRCIHMSQVCNGEDNCGDGSDESYTHARCGEQNVMACDFSNQDGISDGYCGFDHEGWFRTNKPHSPYGPNGDHTNTTYGYYVYTDVNSSDAVLLGPEVTLPLGGATSQHCLSFWYYVYGRPASAALRVYIGHAQAYSRPEWSRLDAQTDRWIQAQIALRAGQPLQAIFDAKLANSFSGIALDDISVTEGPCRGEDISCNFESGTCSWNAVSQYQHSAGVVHGSLTWRTYRYQATPVLPMYDVTSKDGDGYYLYVNTSSSIRGDGHALLHSPDISSFSGQSHCLHFFYFITGLSADCCTLKLRLVDANLKLGDVLWSRDGTTRNRWLEAAVELNAETPSQILLEGILKEKKKGQMAIDQIILTDGKCKAKVDADCTSSQFRCASGQCISVAFKCDGTVHCEDGSDEGQLAACPTAAPTSPGDTCGSSHFKCPHTGVCIHKSWLCDGFNDCGDSFDESVLVGCRGSSTPPVATSCSANEYRCQNGDCISMATKCDGISNCQDNSDEDWHANCHGDNVPSTSCRANQYHCLNGACISMATKCDGINNCEDNSDEDWHAGCQGQRVHCTTAQFRCGQHGPCIAKLLVCNGERDCLDGSDENSTTADCQSVGVSNVGLGAGAASGIAVAAFVLVLITLLAAIACRRRKRRPRGGASSNSETLRRHISMLEAMRAPMRVPPPYSERYVDNTGFTLDRSTTTSTMTDLEPVSSQVEIRVGLPLDEPPPPYDSVIKNNAEPTTSSEQHRLQPAKGDAPSVVHGRSRSDPARSHQQQRSAIYLGTQALRRGAGARHSARSHLDTSRNSSVSDHVYESIPPRGLRGPPTTAPPPPPSNSNRGSNDTPNTTCVPFSQSTPVHTTASDISHQGAPPRANTSHDTSASVVYFSDIENALLPPTSV